MKVTVIFYSHLNKLGGGYDINMYFIIFNSFRILLLSPRLIH